MYDYTKGNFFSFNQRCCVRCFRILQYVYRGRKISVGVTVQRRGECDCYVHGSYNTGKAKILRLT